MAPENVDYVILVVAYYIIIYETIVIAYCNIITTRDYICHHKYIFIIV